MRAALKQLSLVMILFIALAGCTTRSKAKSEAKAAYMAGQQQAMERILQNRNAVTILGPVRTPLVTWTADLTLSKALIAAQYYARTDPQQITIVRDGQPIPVDPKQLLAGDDIPLQAGD